MAIELIDTIKPKNGGSFPMVEAKDVAMPDGSRLSEFNPGSGLPEIAPATEIIVMEEQDFTGFAENVDFGGLFSVNCDFSDSANMPTIVEGDIYHVLWDGEEYRVTANDASAVGEGLLFLGNGSPIGLSGNGEPFAIGWSQYGMSLFSVDSTETTHRVGIYQNAASPDEGKFLRVVDGKLALVALTDVSEVGM